MRLVYPCRTIAHRRSHLRRSFAFTLLLFSVVGLAVAAHAAMTGMGYSPVHVTNRGEAPRALALTPDGAKLYVACTLTDNVAVVNTATQQVLRFIPVGNGPIGLGMSPGGEAVVVTCEFDSKLYVIDTALDRIAHTPPAPRYCQDALVRSWSGPMAAPDVEVYVTNKYLDAVLVYDNIDAAYRTTIPVGLNPKPLFLDNDDKLYVGNQLAGTVSVIDVTQNVALPTVFNVGAPPRDLARYLGWIVAPVVSSDDAGDEVLAAFLNIVTLIDPVTKTVTPFDMQPFATSQEAVAVPEGLAVSADGSVLLVSMASSNNLLVFHSAGFDSLLHVGRNPREVVLDSNTLRAYVACMIDNSIAIVNLPSLSVSTLQLAPPPDLGDDMQAGRMTFFDAKLTFPQAPQLACESCHPFFGIDGRSRFEFGRPRNVPISMNVGAGKTDPALSTGVISFLDLFGLTPSISDPVFGPKMAAFINTQVSDPPSPYTNLDGTLTPAAQRGMGLFFDAVPGAPKLQCANCHQPPFFTSNVVANFSIFTPDTLNVGTSRHAIPGGPGTFFRDGVNIPQLLGLWDTQPYTSDGRYKTLDEVLQNIDITQIHLNQSGQIHGHDDLGPEPPPSLWAPTLVQGLTPQQYADLKEFLLSLSSQTDFQIPTDVGLSPERPLDWLLPPNAPNPFNPATRIVYRVQRPGFVRLRVYAADGRMVREIDRGMRGTGEYRVAWNGLDEAGKAAASGVYFLRLESGDGALRRKITLVK